MSVRSRLYRCHVFSYVGPQTEGVNSRWTQNLQPVGDREILMGELVEMYAVLENGSRQLDENTRIRFDILEQDHLLTGGLDDRMVSYMGPNAPSPDEGFEREVKTVHFKEMAQCREVLAEVQRFHDDHLPNVSHHILILKEPGEATRFHIISWWIVRREEGIFDPEFYFIVNIDDDFEDQSEPILDVTRTDLDRLFAENQLHDRHMANVLFRRRLESMRPDEVQRFRQNATDPSHRAYLLRVLDFVGDQEILGEAPVGDRERITFIMGQQEPTSATNRFYRSATHYFQINPAGNLVNEPRTLEALRNYLENNRPDNGQPWGEINIVVHANEEGGMSIPVFAGEEDVQIRTLRPAVDTPLLFAVDISNPRRFLTQLQGANNPLSQFLQGHFSEDLRQRVAAYDRLAAPDEKLLQDLVTRLSWLMARRSIYSEQRFAQIELSQETRRLIEENPQGSTLIRLNRLLLQQAFADSIRQYPQGILAEREFEPLADRLVDARTTIRIRGCALGRNQDILRLLSAAFGGTDMQRPVVRAPKHLQDYEYETEDGRIIYAEEFLSEFWFVTYPRPGRNRYPQVRRPSDDELVDMFREKYPDADMDWRVRLPQAVTRNRCSGRFTFTYNYNPVPQSADALRRLVRAAVENASTWTNMRETGRTPNDDGSTTIHVEARRGNEVVRVDLPVGPTPPGNNAGRLDLLREEFGEELINQYTWTFQPSDRAIGSGQREYRLRAEGCRTILRIARELRARFQPLFDLAAGLEADLDNHVLPDPLREAFEAACVLLSQGVYVSILRRGRSWLIVNPRTSQTFALRLEDDQLHVYAERSLVTDEAWQISRAHPPSTDDNHFGEECPVQIPTRPLGQNILPE